MLASVTVHDLPPTAGYLAGEHVRIRGDLGLLTRSEDEERAALGDELLMWRAPPARVRDARPDDDSERGLLIALHKYLAISPAVCLGTVPARCGGGQAAPRTSPAPIRSTRTGGFPLCDSDGKAVLLEDLPNLQSVSDLVKAITLS